VEVLASIGNGSTRRERLTSGLGLLHDRGETLLARLWNGLAGIDRVRLYGPLPGTPRTPTVSFVVDGVPSESVAVALAERAVFVSHGDFYATTVVERLGHGADGVVRAGCACYTTRGEVDRLIDGVRAVAMEG
jgi:selenocysteine lyase/cysteine desulfurase